MPNSTSPGDGLVKVGRVGKPHGLDGSFVVENASADPARFAVGAVLLVEGEEAQIVAAKRAGGRPVIRLDRKVERGADLAVALTDLPPAEEGSYYVFELVAEDRCERTLLRQPREGVGNQGEDVELHWHLT